MRTMIAGSVRLFFAAAVILVPLAGCFNSVFTTANVTYPVLVGPVDCIGGAPAQTPGNCADLMVRGKVWQWVSPGPGAGGGSGSAYLDTPEVFDAALLLEERGNFRTFQLTDISTGSMNGGMPVLPLYLWYETWHDVKFRICDREQQPRRPGEGR